MLRIYTCITQEHDLRLVLLAALICIFAAYTAFSLLARAAEARNWTRLAWTAGAGIAAGSGIWATHFIAMLAFSPQVPTTYAIIPTFLSINLAGLISFLGFGLAMQGHGHAAGLERRLYIVIGGIVAGAGISAMHYVGMSAMSLYDMLHYDKVMVGVSLFIGLMMGGVATAIAFSDGQDAFTLRRRAIATLMLTLGICGMHFTGMAASTITLDPSIAVETEILSTFWLAFGVTAVAVVVLALSLAGAIFDQHLSGQRAAEAAKLKASENRFRQLADATFEGIVIHRGGRVLDTNAAFAELVGRPQESLVGRNVLDLCMPDSHARITSVLSKTEEEGRGETALEIDLRHADGSAVSVEAYGRTMPFEGGDARVVALRDIRERKAAEERIHHMAHHDALTGLPNRVLFHDRLTQAVARAKRTGNTVAVLCLDLDRFKNVNDLNGHAVGDELLRQVAQRLGANIRADDTVARLSGDEFAIIQVGVSHPDGPAIMAERLVQSIAKPFDLGGQQTLIGTSIGISLFPGDGEKGEDLVRAADTALYRAKEAGRSTFRFFEAAMDSRLQERRHLERDLRQAMAERQLELHYQPLAHCDNARLIGFEALLRWTHPERGAISPAEFIPLAEECGLIMQLGSWVLRTACQEAVTWPEDKIVAVNLSPIQFRHADMAKEVLTILDQTGLAANRLELEITEGVLIDDTDRTLETLNALKAAGVRISLDDFGTGYSSLSYLHRFPFDKIKIDRSFIWEMEKNPDSMSIVRAVIALGRSLRITVTAEGVETPNQLALLQNENCDQAQGFLLGRPLARADVKRLLEVTPRLVQTELPLATKAAE